jgi:hypothetical protein
VGTLPPDFQHPYAAVSQSFYSFDVQKTSQVTILSLNTPLFANSETYIIYPKGQAKYQILKKNSTLSLDAGSYILEIVDRLTQVNGGGSEILVTRPPNAENYENYGFELRVSGLQ